MLRGSTAHNKGVHSVRSTVCDRGAKQWQPTSNGINLTAFVVGKWGAANLQRPLSDISGFVGLSHVSLSVSVTVVSVGGDGGGVQLTSLCLFSFGLRFENGHFETRQPIK